MVLVRRVPLVALAFEDFGVLDQLSVSAPLLDELEAVVSLIDGLVQQLDEAVLRRVQLDSVSVDGRIDHAGVILSVFVTLLKDVLFYMLFFLLVDFKMHDGIKILIRQMADWQRNELI